MNASKHPNNHVLSASHIWLCMSLLIGSTVLPQSISSLAPVRAADKKSDKTSVPKKKSKNAKDEKAPDTTPKASATDPNVPTKGPELDQYLKTRYLEYSEALLKATDETTLNSFRTTRANQRVEQQKSELLTRSGEQGQKAFERLFQLQKEAQPKTIEFDSVSVQSDRAELKATASKGGSFLEAMANGSNKLGATPTAATTTEKSESNNSDTTAQTQSAESPTTKVIGKIIFQLENGNWNIDSESWTAAPVESKLPEGKKNEAGKTNIWCEQALTMALPKGGAAGRLHGHAFKVDNAELQYGFLLLNQGTDPFRRNQFAVYSHAFHTKPDKQQLIVKDGKSPTTKFCSVQLSSDSRTETFDADKPFGMKLTFGQRRNNMIPGTIILRLPDKDKSFVMGSFTAKIVNTAGNKPI